MATKDETTTGTKSAKGAWQGSLLIGLKFALAFLLLPLVIGSTAALQGQIDGFDATIKHTLWSGLVIYLILKFFVYDFSHVYKFGQGMVTFCFQFLKPLVNAASYVIPIYTVFVLLAYAAVAALGQLAAWKSILLTLVSATFSMHIILTAQDLYAKDSVFGKPTYFFGMELVYIIDVFLIALVMNVVLPGFSFIEFFKSLGGVSLGMYKTAFGQLFGF
ncbi:MAG: hypothetical protein HQL20_01395 [Candidatus Omnitrophica bacterium]|nr:hypothetical protein [Candidatus Omnitrophota bacterium]